MRKMFRFSSLFLVLVVILICVSGAASPVYAIGLDPVSFLYPIWQAYGMANGITVTTIGGDQFTQQGFNGLFNEWQQSEVSQGVQSTVQTISDFVNTISGAVSVVTGQASVSGLLTKLRLGSLLVGKLARFWNWIIVEKLGGSSFDSVNFDDSSGNISVSGAVPFLVPSTEFNVGYIGSSTNIWARYEYKFYNPQSFDVYIVWAHSADLQYIGPLVLSRHSFRMGNYSDGVYGYRSFGDMWGLMDGISGYNSTYDLYCYSGNWGGYTTTQFHPNPLVPYLGSMDEAMSSVDSWLASGGQSVSGSITVAPEVGVDTLGFPDTSQPDYVPADTNIDWNIPYDEVADTNDYLDDAYQKSLDNDLQLGDQISDSPVTGSGEVGSVGEYVTPGLAEVFPFCIPFDIYRFFTLLVAEPVAPSWTAQLAFPEELGGTQSVTIDLNSDIWNNLAAIVRTMELLAFIIGLAYVTRSMFIRG